MLNILMAIGWLIYMFVVIRQPRIRQIDLILPLVVLIIHHTVIGLNNLFVID
ncbi:MAG: hypothetical protein GOVbin1096_9 [Prokaryotic dsDNA virus sp.]|jgi:hypothetical protein|nr:MAG: hypothetical protein GOVbin1096_9 [Prokaryotic dsDNA virus sp.]